MMKYNIILGLLLASFSISAQVISTDTLTNDTTKVIKKTILNKTTAALANGSNEDKRFLPNFSPLSPNAAGIQKFQDFQVNLAAGSPNISLPIFTAKSGNISLPIILRYGASNGHTLTDLASWVGWGWNLDLGVNMSRSIRGNADDIIATTAYVRTNDGFEWDLCSSSADYSLGIAAKDGSYDLEPDLFSYSTGSYSGKFYIRKGTLEPFLIPFQPVKITNDLTNSTRINQWNVIDPSGQKYIFGKDKLGALIHDNQTINATNTGFGSDGVVTWHLTEIQSPNTDDKIEIEYYPEDGQSNLLQLQSYSWSASAITSGPGLSQSINPTENLQSRSNSQRYIKKISFDNGYLEFITSGSTEVRDDQPESKYLKRIDIYSHEEGQDKLIKSFRFSYTYFTDRTGSNGRLKLDKIEEGNGDFTEKTETSFEYITNNYSWKYNTGALGADIEDFKKQDYFGYYNGKPNNHLFDIETFQLEESLTNTPVAVVGGKANRDTEASFLSEGVLKKIILPTKGYTEFQYEPQQFKLNSLIRLGGGLRIKTITQKPDQLTSGVVKTFTYSSEDGIDIGLLTPLYNGSTIIGV